MSENAWESDHKSNGILCGQPLSFLEMDKLLVKSKNYYPFHINLEIAKVYTIYTSIYTSVYTRVHTLVYALVYSLLYNINFHKYKYMQNPY